MNNTMLQLAAAVAMSALSLCGTTYYLDADNGSDKAVGTSPETAWRSLRMALPSRFKPGDKILFKRGCLFRGGTLQLASGTPENPVIYSVYGEGTKPILQPSLDFNHPDAWKEIAPDLWQTVPSAKYRPLADAAPMDLRSSKWTLYAEQPSEASCTQNVVDGQSVYSVNCVKPGSSTTNIQLIGPDVEDSSCEYELKIRLRASKPFTLPAFRIMMKTRPWYLSHAASQASFAVTDEWQEATFHLGKINNIGDGSVRLNVFLGTALPADCRFDFIPLALQKIEADGYPVLMQDVGNIVFNHGEFCGWKRWKLEELKQERDFMHDATTHLLTMRHVGNPGGGRYRSLEFCRKVNIVSHGGVHDVVVDGLWVRYTGAHGFSGGGVRNYVIRNCDISYIGGSVLYVRGGRPTRYGNGVEFWSNSEDCLVENNRIWQVYDVAITNQGDIPNTPQRNLIYRNNLIFQCEQSYEHWRTPESAWTENIQFVNNTCLQAGYGWSHQQRPDKNACHLLGYRVIAKTRNVVIRNNVFYNAVDSLLLHYSDWRPALDIDNNIWWQDDPERLAIRIHNAKLQIKAKDFADWQNIHQKDRHSLYVKPIFVRPDFEHPENGDFHLAPDSPGAGVMGIPMTPANN